MNLKLIKNSNSIKLSQTFRLLQFKNIFNFLNIKIAFKLIQFKTLYIYNKTVLKRKFI